MAVGAGLALGSGFNSGSGSKLLERVGSWPGYGRGPAADVALAGNYAYLAIEEGGLLVLDITDPARPVRVGGYRLPGRTKRIKVAGSRAYVGADVSYSWGGCVGEQWRGSVAVLDVSSAAAPVLLGSYTTGSGIQDLAVDGDRVYIADPAEGLHVVDTRDPARPKVLSIGKVTAGGQGFCLEGQQLYWAVQDGWKWFDVSQPVSPRLVGEWPLDAPSDGVEVRGICKAGDRVYGVGKGRSGGRLSIYDASAKATERLEAGQPLQQLGGITLTSTALSVAVLGDRAYVGLEQGGLGVVDVSNPTQPTYERTWPTAQAAVRIQVSAAKAFLAEYHQGLQILDISNPSATTLLSQHDTGLTAREVRLAGNRAYLLSSDTLGQSRITWDSSARSRIEVLDVTNPSQPVLLGSSDFPYQIGSLGIAGNLAWFGSSQVDPGSVYTSGRLGLIEIGDPAQMLQLSHTLISTNSSFVFPFGIHLSGAYAYVAAGITAGLQIFDISNPANPMLLGQTNAAGGEARLSGNLLYIGNSSGVQVFNVDDPKTPKRFTALGDLFSTSSGLCLAGNYAHSGVGWSGFQVFDLRLPTHPVLITSYPTAGEVQALVADGQYLFVAEGWKGLKLLDVSQPAQPVPIGSAETAGKARDVQVSGRTIYVAEGGGGLGIFNLPTAPVTITENPVSMTAAAGSLATLSVGAYSHEPLRYQWYVGQSGDLSHPVPGADASTLSVPPSANPAAYWVRVSNTSGFSDSPAALVKRFPPVSVEFVGLWPGYRRGPALEARVEGNLAYVAAGALQIWDLTDLTAERPVGVYDPRDSIVNSVALSGKRAFLACGDKGLQVVDVSAPMTPTLIGSLAVSGYASKVVVSGPYAYLLIRDSHLAIVDINDPSRPQAVGQCPIPGTDIQIVGRYAYIAEAIQQVEGANVRGGLLVIDVSDPAQPVEAGALVTHKHATGVFVYGQYACLTHDQSGLQIIDVTNPAQPKPAGQSGFQGASTSGAFVAGGYAYLPLSYNGWYALQVIDVADPAMPKLVAGVGTGNGRSVVVSGQRAYLSTDAGLQVIDITTPNKPAFLGAFDTAGFASQVAVLGRHAYLADGSGGLRVLDVSDPTNPVAVGTYRPPTRPEVRTVATDGQHLFLAPFKMLDVTDPVRPVPVGGISDDDCQNIVPAGKYAYLTDPGRTDVAILDLSSPAVPQVLGTVTLPSGSAEMAVVDPFAYRPANNGGLQILDASVPGDLRWVGTYYADGSILSVSVRNPFAYVGANQSPSWNPGLEIVDVRDPERPNRVSRLSLPAAEHIALWHSYACVTGNGLQVVDIGDPYEPSRVGGHDFPAGTGGLQLVDNVAYVAAHENGLAIYRITPQLTLNPPALDASGVHLSWVGAPGICLQIASQLSIPDWQEVPQSGGASRVSLPLSAAGAFYRLVRR